jgi:hypothetical protein
MIKGIGIVLFMGGIVSISISILDFFSNQITNQSTGIENFMVGCICSILGTMILYIGFKKEKYENRINKKV